MEFPGLENLVTTAYSDVPASPLTWEKLDELIKSFKLRNPLLCPMCGKESFEEDLFAVRDTCCGKEYGHYSCFIKRLDPFADSLT